MASEQFSLCWDNFHKNMSSGMNSLLENEDLVDVTLAVQGKCLKAHKMVLSVCSPYFKELFKSNPCQHPIVFMKDVSYEALSDLLQFMYQGEVQVSQENLTTFIKTAEALQIKGLTGDGNGSADNETTENSQEKPVHHQIEEYKPPPRPKKQPPPAPVVSSSPQVKRPRLSSTSTSNDSQPIVPPLIAKTEPISTPASNITESAPPVQFKMEPYETHSLIDETGDENFGDDTLDDNTVDDTEDYSMMEGGVGEEEPQAGTSTDGAGEGQGMGALASVRKKHTITGTSGVPKEKNLQKGVSNKVQNPTTNNHPTNKKQTVQSLSSVKSPTSDEKLDHIMKTLTTVVANQNKIMAEIEKFRSVFEIMLQKSNDPFVSTSEIARETISHFDPIDSLERLKELNEDLKNTEIFNKYVDGLSFICGRDTKTKGLDHCYLLVDKLFTRHFFTLCSWAGGSKGPFTKFPFKFYENVITLFFNLVHLADPKFTLEECEEFFKGVIKNCQRRNCARVRSSKSKRRPKGLSYAMRNTGTEDYEFVSQPLKEEDIFFDDMSAELIDDDPDEVL